MSLSVLILVIFVVRVSALHGMFQCSTWKESLMTHELRAAIHIVWTHLPYIQQENHEVICKNYDELRKFLRVRSVDLLELNKKSAVYKCLFLCLCNYGS